GSLAEVEHMWIKPEHMGNGVGRALFKQVVARAKSMDARAVELSADPNAEGFYRRMGATRIGEVRSEIEGQPRVLPRMSVDLESPSPIGRGGQG
ncbi:MAG TPA: GNAT family N-acetyltransferase, partial [Pyrinomonadaceae bacterium]|nr:GNAT family N-acetyltransferase [Pyrinomonadaceae bacterium]